MSLAVDGCGSAAGALGDLLFFLGITPAEGTGIGIADKRGRRSERGIGGKKGKKGKKKQEVENEKVR
jgi:hypothetical protein